MSSCHLNWINKYFGTWRHVHECRVFFLSFSFVKNCILKTWTRVSLELYFLTRALPISIISWWIIPHPPNPCLVWTQLKIGAFPLFCSVSWRQRCLIPSEIIKDKSALAICLYEFSSFPNIDASLPTQQDKNSRTALCELFSIIFIASARSLLRVCKFLATVRENALVEDYACSFLVLHPNLEGKTG